jgi:Spy/CpxP family protein refolding chaperone
MFLRNKLTLVGLALVLLTGLGAAVQAQQPQPSNRDKTPGNETRPFGRGDERRGMRSFGRAPLAGLRELNLSDDQKQQVRAIMERNFESTKAVREELRTLGQKRFEGTLTPEEQTRAKNLHQQMAQSMKTAITEVQGILTAEQKAKLEQLRKEEGPKRGRHGRRFGRPDADQSNNPPKP